MPSECFCVFDWLYKRVMPQLLGKQVPQWTNLSLTDGDNNEYGPKELPILSNTPATASSLANKRMEMAFLVSTTT
jgi:hypothetical protein